MPASASRSAYAGSPSWRVSEKPCAITTQAARRGDCVPAGLYSHAAQCASPDGEREVRALDRHSLLPCGACSGRRADVAGRTCDATLAEA